MQFAVNIIFISHPPSLYTWAGCYAVGQGGQGWSMRSTSQFCRVQSVVPRIVHLAVCDICPHKLGIEGKLGEVSRLTSSEAHKS